MRDDRAAGMSETITTAPEPRARGAVTDAPATTRAPGVADDVAGDGAPVRLAPRRRPAGDRWRAPLLRFGLPLGVAAILLLGALWPRAPFALDVGAPGDRLFLANVNGDERLAEYSYRWTGWRGQDTTLTVPGWGAVRRARHAARAGPPRPRPR